MKYIEEKYGKKYVGYVKQAKKKENVQDAHEAIRPTSVLREPTKVKEYLSNDEFKLYSLIYKRTLASLMADATVNQTTIVFDNNDYKFKTTGQILVFDGYLKVYGDYESSEDKILPDYAAQMHTKVLQTTIRESVKCQEAQTLRIPLFDYEPKCTTAIDYNALIDEITKYNEEV